MEEKDKVKILTGKIRERTGKKRTIIEDQKEVDNNKKLGRVNVLRRSEH